MTIITTAGGSTSNSYVTLAEANAYFETGFFNTAWDTLASDTIRENWIIEAARAIDRFHFRGFRWKGNDQALSFPRVNPHGVDFYRYDRYGEFRGDDSETPIGQIPEDVKRAQYAMIMFLYLNQSSTDGTIESKEIKKVGAVNGLIDVEYLPEKSQNTIKISSGATIEAVEQLLSPWLKSKNSVPIRR